MKAVKSLYRQHPGTGDGRVPRRGHDSVREDNLSLRETQVRQKRRRSSRGKTTRSVNRALTKKMDAALVEVLANTQDRAEAEGRVVTYTNETRRYYYYAKTWGGIGIFEGTEIIKRAIAVASSEIFDN